VVARVTEYPDVLTSQLFGSRTVVSAVGDDDEHVPTARSAEPSTSIDWILDGTNTPLKSDRPGVLDFWPYRRSILDSSRDHTKRTSITADRQWRAHENWAMSLCKDAFGNTKTGRDLRVTSDHDQINVAIPRGP